MKPVRCPSLSDSVESESFVVYVDVSTFGALFCFHDIVVLRMIKHLPENVSVTSGFYFNTIFWLLLFNFCVVSCNFLVNIKYIYQIV